MDGNVAVDWDTVARALRPLADLPSGSGARWDAVVVVDTHPSMTVWRDTVDRFLATLRDAAGFARVEVRLLDTDVRSPAELVLHADPDGPATPPSELVAAHRIVLVVTDGTGAAWHAGAVQPALREWGRTAPVAVVQLLPQLRWYRTGVRPRRLCLHAPAAGTANAALDWRPHGPVPDVLDGPVSEPDEDSDHAADPVPVPVLELDPEWLSAWVRLLTGGDAQLPALLAEPWRPPEPAPPPPGAEAGASARSRVREFTSWATPTALSLATHLAAAPLNLPVMKAVQRELVGDSDTSHLSEVLNSGLLHPVAAGVGAAGVAFEFHRGVREELLAVGRRADTTRVLRVVDECLGPTVPAVHGLSQVVDDPDAVPVQEVTPETEPFVQVERAVLQALSGRYLARARRLDRALTANAGPPADKVVTMEIPTATGDRETGGAGVSSSTVAERTASERTPSRAPVIWGNVPPRNPNFTGRETLMALLHEGIRAGTTAVLPQALHGMGGVGKSQLAVEYVYRYQGDFDLIWWIPAERPPQIDAALVELAHRLQLPIGPEANTAVPAVREALRLGRPHGNWLLIFDNAESPDAVRRYFPAGGPGSIMVTSRNPQWTNIAQPLEVDVFTRTESIELLRQRGPELSDEDADRLAEALGDLPLALDQAAAWRAETGMPADEYLRLFEQKRTELMEASAPLDYQLPVAAAWNVSLDRLAISSPGALQLLQVCSFFAPLPIPRTLFRQTHTGNVPAALDRVLEDPIELGRAIREINKYALVKIDHRTNSIQMHRLVQAVLVDQLVEDEQALMRHQAHIMLATSDPGDPNAPGQWRTYGDLYPHTMAAEAHRSVEDKRVRRLVDNVSRYLYWWGNHEAAYELARQAYEALHERLGATDPATLRAGHWVGWLLFVLGRFQEARDLNAEIGAAYQEIGSEDTEDSLRALGAVAADRRVAGDFTGALKLAQEVYDRHVRALGPEDPDTINAAHNVAVSLRLTGDLSRALEIDDRNRRLRTQLFGTDHPITLESTRNVIIDRRELGDYVGARAEAQAVADLLRHQLSPGHPQTLRALRTLSAVLRKAGEHQAARQVSEEAREGLVTRYGENHPDTVAATLNLSTDLRATGDLEAAADLGRQANQRYRELIGDGHPHTIAARLNLAVTLRLRGDLAQARAIDEEGYQQLHDQLGADHPLALAAAVNLASDLYAQGETAAAYERDLDTSERLRRVLGEDHPTTLSCLGNVTIDLEALGRVDEARQLQADIVARCNRVLGPDHPATAVAADLGVRAYCDLDPVPL